MIPQRSARATAYILLRLLASLPSSPSFTAVGLALANDAVGFIDAAREVVGRVVVADVREQRPVIARQVLSLDAFADALVRSRQRQRHTAANVGLIFGLGLDQHRAHALAPGSL